MEFVNVNKLTPGIDIPDFLFYLCAMDNLKQFIIKRKYDLLSISSIILMMLVNVLFAIPAIVFLAIGESKSKY
tara:strand:- start:132 stop:350 length:219 start_codon:yes stop_codon:yes gene_type:complete